jgi:hypothetical protein
MNSWIFSMVWMCVKFFLWFATFTPSERVALAAAFLVLAGVVGEYIIELDAIDKQERLKKRLKWLSIALLVVGLSGDALGIIMGQAEMAALTKEAGDAATSAHNAAIDAKNAHDLAQGASTIAGTADTAAGEAARKVKVVGMQADRIGAMLGETISLVNARRVDDPDKLSAEFRKHFSGQKIQLVSYAGDVEAWGLCNQLVNITKDAGMVPEDICGKAMFTSPLISPLSVTAPTWDEALGISGALSSGGNIVCSSLIGPHLIVFVGVKSPFIIGETAQTRDVERRAAAMKKQRKLDAKH